MDFDIEQIEVWSGKLQSIWYGEKQIGNPNDHIINGIISSAKCMKFDKYYTSGILEYVSIFWDLSYESTMEETQLDVKCYKSKTTFLCDYFL